MSFMNLNPQPHKFCITRLEKVNNPLSSFLFKCILKSLIHNSTHIFDDLNVFKETQTCLFLYVSTLVVCILKEIT